MTIETDEKRFLTLRNALWVIGTLVVVGLAAGAFLFYRADNAIDAESDQLKIQSSQLKQIEKQVIFAAQDTPVVLLGGSLKLMQASTSATKTWTPLGTGIGYSTAGTGPISTIVIKNNSGGSDETDRLQVSIPDNTSWSVDLFTQKPFPNKAKVTISPEANMSTIDMVLDNNGQIGILCPDPTTSPANPTTVYYNDSGKCPSPAASDAQTVFTSMTVTVDSIVVGSLNCFDAVVTPGSVSPNHCKIVFRTK